MQEISLSSLSFPLYHSLVQLYANIEGYNNPATSFKRRDHPHIIYKDDELRKGARPETEKRQLSDKNSNNLSLRKNPQKLREYKQKRYKNYRNKLITTTSVRKLLLRGITSL